MLGTLIYILQYCYSTLILSLRSFTLCLHGSLDHHKSWQPPTKFRSGIVAVLVEDCGKVGVDDALGGAVEVVEVTNL